MVLIIIINVINRSGPEWEERFGRKQLDENQVIPTFSPQFQIEAYLSHQVLLSSTLFILINDTYFLL